MAQWVGVYAAAQEGLGLEAWLRAHDLTVVGVPEGQRLHKGAKHISTHEQAHISITVASSEI